MLGQINLKSRETLYAPSVLQFAFDKRRVLLETSHLQKMAQRYEEALEGKYKPCLQDPGALTEETEKALKRQQLIKQVISEVIEANPESTPALEKTLMHFSILT